MRFTRHFTKDNSSPYDEIEFRQTSSEIRNPDGSLVFQAEDIEVPSNWSQVACDVLAQKYFRKAGVPAKLKKVKEDDVPEWLWRGVPDKRKPWRISPKTKNSPASTAQSRFFDRLAGTWTYWGWKGGYFDLEADAQIYFDEMRYMLAHQMAAPNSPQWFNTGLHWPMALMDRARATITLIS